MKTIILNPASLPSLSHLFSKLRFFISHETNGGAYEISNHKESYPDEAELAFSTFRVNHNANPEFIQSTLNRALPDEAKDQDHVILAWDRETLEVHYNDATITLIYHSTGQF